MVLSRPEEVKKEEVEKCFTVGKVTVNAVEGGLRTDGLYFTRFGDKDDSIEACIACVKVGIK